MANNYILAQAISMTMADEVRTNDQQIFMMVQYMNEGKTIIEEISLTRTLSYEFDGLSQITSENVQKVFNKLPKTLQICYQDEKCVLSARDVKNIKKLFKNELKY